jgi:hypothetical protein
MNGSLEWFPLAKSLKLVSASMMIGNIQHVLTTQDEWLPFQEMLALYPVDKLKTP